MWEGDGHRTKVSGGINAGQIAGGARRDAVSAHGNAAMQFKNLRLCRDRANARQKQAMSRDVQSIYPTLENGIS